MGVAQDKFQSRYDNAFEGQLMKAEPTKVLSGQSNTDDKIGFGRFVMMDGDDYGVKLVTDNLADAKQIVGVSLRNVAWENSADGEPVYKKGEIVSYVNDATIYMVCHGGCNRGDKVHVVVKTAGGELGTAKGTSDANTLEVDATWTRKAADGDIVGVKLGDLLG